MNKIYLLRHGENKDYRTQDFLSWFVSEQVKEEANMLHLVLIVNTLGEQAMVTPEHYLPKE